MVYSKVYLIYGSLVTKDDLLKFGVEFEGDEDDDCKYVIDTKLKCGASVWTFPCCSGMKNYIVGYKIGIMWRKTTKCEKCELLYQNYRACDTCLGMLENDISYNVDEILENAVECPLENVCRKCGYLNEYIVNSSNDEPILSCTRCNYQSKYTNLDWYRHRRFPIINNNKKCLYFMLDDCLYCS